MLKPTKVSHLPVVATTAVRTEAGSHPHAVVVCGRQVPLAQSPTGYEWVTWKAFTTDGGATWEGESGHYFTDKRQAISDFVARSMDAQFCLHCGKPARPTFNHLCRTCRETQVATNHAGRGE